MEIKRLGKEYGNCYQQVDPSDLTINVYAEIYGVQYTSKVSFSIYAFSLLLLADNNLVNFLFQNMSR